MGARKAEIEDVGAMSLVHSRTWKKAYVDFISEEYLENISDEGWIPLFSRALKENVHNAAVYETDGKITGTITFGQARKDLPSETGTLQHPSPLHPAEGEIISLYVLPEYWSTKQGYELMKFAVESLKNQGFKSCFLWVIKDNERAANFYRRFGFTSKGELMTVILAGLPVTEEKYELIF